MSAAFGRATGARTAERFELGKIMVADADPDLVRVVEAALRADGHDVVTATTGWEAVRMAREQLPWLLILDATMPEVSGYEICRHLRSDWRFTDRSVILLASESLPEQRSFGLAVGADDFILKPIDLVELAGRVRLIRRRLVEMMSSSPLTGLPGNVDIQRELQRRVAAGGLVALLYADLDDFKAYNDHNGFLRGDEAIRALAGVLRRALEGRSQPFLGHVGGDDFVILTRPDEAVEIAQDVISGFEEIVTDLYEGKDAARGWFEVRDRRGVTRRQGLLTISIGVATNVERAIGDHRQLVDLASEMKEYAKSRPGNAVAVDRRSQRDLGHPGLSPGPAPTSPDRDLHALGSAPAGLRRSALVEVTQKSRRIPRGSAPGRRVRRRLVGYAAVALLTAGLVAGPATLVLAENARPGAVLWPVKLWIEGARLALERHDEKDVVLRLEFAARRVGELQYVMAQQSPPGLAEKVSENLAEHIEAAMLTLKGLPTDEVDTSGLRSQMQAFLGQSIEVLRGLVATACQGEGARLGPPEAACLGLQRALENSTEAMDVVDQAPGSLGGGEAPGLGREMGPPGLGQDRGPRGEGMYHGPPSHAKDRDPPAQGKGKGPPAQGKGPSAHGKGKGPPAQGKGKEAPAQDKGKEAPAPGADAQPPDQENSPALAGKGKGGK